VIGHSKNGKPLAAGQKEEHANPRFLWSKEAVTLFDITAIRTKKSAMIIF